MSENLNKIASFIEKHHTLCLSTCKDEIPFTCTLFFAYDKTHNSLIVASDEKTQHAQNILQNPHVSGVIYLHTEIVGLIQGIQFQGKMALCKERCEIYYKRFPYALVMQPTLWSIELEWIKMTDNKLGFGKKIIWSLGEV